MSFTKTLLSGAALCALCTAPALAAKAPNIHLAGADTPMTMKVGSPGHVKTAADHSRIPRFSETITFTATLAAQSLFHVPTLLWGETWYSPSTCTQPSNEFAKFPKHTTAAKITVATTTGSITGCTGTFTFYGPDYELGSRTATSDSFPGAVIAKNFVGYNLILRANTDLTLTH